MTEPEPALGMMTAANPLLDLSEELGFARAVSQANITGPGDVFLVDDVQCVGTEASLFDCPHVGQTQEDCSASEAVFVTCE